MPGKVAIQVKTADEVTESGLYLPQETVRSTHERRATQGVVVAIGEEDPDEDILYYYCKTCGDGEFNKRFYSDEAADKHLMEGPEHHSMVAVHRRKFGLGDTVVFGKYSGTEIKYRPPADDQDEKNTIERKARPAPETIIIMSVKDILCRVRAPEEAVNIQVRA